MIRQRIFLIALLSGGLAFQARDQRLPLYKASVNLVTVDAVVTDRKGAYPPDLAREDFQIFEDGVLEKIQDFRRVYTPAVAIAGGPEAAIPAKAPELPAEPPRLFLFVIDNLNSQWTSLYQVAEALEKVAVESLRAHDLAAVMTVSNTAGLVQSFTGDAEALRLGVRKALGLSLQGTMSAGTAAKAIEAAEHPVAVIESACLYTGLPEGMDIDTVAWRDAARIFATQNDYSARGSLYTLESVCRSLGAIKGRKTVIMISEGYAVSDPVQAALPRVIDAANKANVAIYTINPRGLEQVDPARPVTLTQPAQARTFQSTGNIVAGNSVFDLIRQEDRANSREDCLGEVADATGGVTLRNSNEFQRGLDRAIQDGHSYYELTYVPANTARDGRYRRIEVRLSPRLKGYSVRARKGYLASEEFGTSTLPAEVQMVRALNSPEAGPDASAALQTAVFADPRGGNWTRISVALHPEEVTLRQEGDGRAGGLQVLAAVYDERGAIVREFKQEYRLRLDESALRGFLADGAVLSWDTRLAPARYQVKAVVRDTAGGRMAVRGGELDVPSFDSPDPQMTPIVLARARTSLCSVFLDEGLPADYDPMLLRSASLVPAGDGPYPKEGFLIALFHVYNVSEPGSPDYTEYVCETSLYRENQVVARSELIPVEDGFPHPQRGFVLAPRVPLSSLASGTYRLEIGVSLPDGSRRMSRAVNFQVR